MRLQRLLTQLLCLLSGHDYDGRYSFAECERCGRLSFHDR